MRTLCKYDPEVIIILLRIIIASFAFLWIRWDNESHNTWKTYKGRTLLMECIAAWKARDIYLIYILHFARFSLDSFFALQKGSSDLHYAKNSNFNVNEKTRLVCLFFCCSISSSLFFVFLSEITRVQWNCGKMFCAWSFNHDSQYGIQLILTCRSFTKNVISRQPASELAN